MTAAATCAAGPRHRRGRGGDGGERQRRRTAHRALGRSRGADGDLKRPIAGPAAVGRENLRGDGQADLVFHGGALKAVYAYPSEHHAFWHDRLGRLPAGWGVFGENLTIAGLLEDDVCVGDVLGVGSSLLRVTEPRYPCFKLGLRLGDDTVADRFVRADRPGFHLAVEQEGEIRARDAAAVIAQHPARLSVTELMRLRALGGPEDVEALRAALTSMPSRTSSPSPAAPVDPFAGSLRALAADSDRLAVRILYSRQEDPPVRVTADFVVETVGGTDVDVPPGGPEAMVRELLAALRDAGVAAERIGVEAFGPAAAHALGPRSPFRPAAWR
jgi:MOSC domain-containing protein YiiM